MSIMVNDSTGERVRLIDTHGNIARTNAGYRHTSKLFHGGSSLQSLGYSDQGKSLSAGLSMSDFEALHPRDADGRFVGK